MPARALPSEPVSGGTTLDHIEILRAELRAVTEKLDVYLAGQARPRLAAVPIPAATAGPDVLDGLPPLIAVERAAKLLGLSRASAYRLATADELPARRLGGRVYIVTAGLRPLLQADGAA